MTKSGHHRFEGLSVVIPTHGRSGSVCRLLSSLAQACQEVGFATEVIVVDSSEGEQAQAIRDYCRRYGTRYLATENNVSLKRNMGARAAGNPIVLFVDSDCEVTSNTLAGHMAAYDLLEPAMAGALGPTEFIGRSTALWRIVAGTLFVLPYTLPKSESRVTFVIGTNVSFHRERLLTVSGFDETWPFLAAGEDIDLGLRLQEAGFYVVSAPAAVSYHSRDTWTSISELLSRIFRWGRAQYHVIARHPEHAAFALPTLTPLFLCLLVLTAVQVCLTHRVWLSVIPLIWWQASLVFTSAYEVYARRTPRGSFIAKVGANLLYAVYEWGQCIEALRCGDIRGCAMRLAPPAPHETGRVEGVGTSWGEAVAFLLALLCCGWLAQ